MPEMVTFLLSLKLGHFLENLHDWKFWKATHSCGNVLKILIYFQSTNLFCKLLDSSNWSSLIVQNYSKHNELNLRNFVELGQAFITGNESRIIFFSVSQIISDIIGWNEACKCFPFKCLATACLNAIIQEK